MAQKCPLHIVPGLVTLLRSPKLAGLAFAAGAAAGVGLLAWLTIREEDPASPTAALAKAVRSRRAAITVTPSKPEHNVHASPAPADPDVPRSADELKRQVAALGWPALVPRAMVSAGAKPPPAGGLDFTIMQFNVLAEGLSSGPACAPPLRLDAAPKPSEFGGFDAVERPEECLDWQKRRLRLLEEVARVSPDVLALEECDRWADWFEPALRALGYDGLWAPKRNAPGLAYGYHSDGTALLWRRAAVEPVSAEGCYLDGADGSEGSRPYVIATLRRRGGGLSRALGQGGGGAGELLLVGATHLKAKPGEANEASRAADVRQLLAALQRRADALPAAHVLLCGDFNTDPYDVPQHKAACVPAVRAHPLGLRSAYPLPASDADAAFTTWKRRGATEARHMIDYIWHSPRLTPYQTLAPPDAAALEPARLPGFRYPSDHLSIAARLVAV